MSGVVTHPYIVIFGNFMLNSHDVLRSYGIADLPLPMLEITPNRWFDQLSPAAQPVTARALQEAGLLPASHLESLRAQVAFQPEAPQWRTAGTPDWQDFRKLLRPILYRRLGNCLPGTTVGARLTALRQAAR